MEAFALCNRKEEESWEAGMHGLPRARGPSVRLSSRPLPSAVTLGSLSISGEAPDRKGQVSWKAPLGLDSLPPQGGPTPKNEHLLSGLLGKLRGRRLLQGEAWPGPFCFYLRYLKMT